MGAAATSRGVGLDEPRLVVLFSDLRVSFEESSPLRVVSICELLS